MTGRFSSLIEFKDKIITLYYNDITIAKNSSMDKIYPISVIGVNVAVSKPFTSNLNMSCEEYHHDMACNFISLLRKIIIVSSFV